MEKVSLWTCADVGTWLREQGFASYVNDFTKVHKIDGKALLTLTEQDLKQPPLEIPVLGDVKRLMISIKKLQAENMEQVRQLGFENGFMEGSNGQSLIGHQQFASHNFRRLDSERSVYSDYEEVESVEHTAVTATAMSSQPAYRLDPDPVRLVVSAVYMFTVFLLTAFVMAVVHDRVPDMKKYPPLPDIVLDNMPYVPWAFSMCEVTAVCLSTILFFTLVFHKHRFILLRRMFSLFGTVFMLRCITMLITSLSVPGEHLKCEPKPYGNIWEKLYRAFTIWKGFGMNLQGVRTCGDYMFSGHTIVVTMLNHFITEYTPSRMHLLHTFSWVLNIFGIFFILAAHEHYSIDVFVAFYITSRLFLYYHTLANNMALRQADRRRTRYWFPLFAYFESRVNGIVPNEYEWPFSWPKGLKESFQRKPKRR